MLILITKDLFFVPLVSSAAAAQDWEVRVGKSGQDPKLQVEDVNSVAVCLVDLAALSQKDFEATATQLREQFPTARRVAFGPHVHAERLARAEGAGFDQVYTRAQLNAQLPGLVAQWQSQVN